MLGGEKQILLSDHLDELRKNGLVILLMGNSTHETEMAKERPAEQRYHCTPHLQAKVKPGTL